MIDKNEAEQIANKFYYYLETYDFESAEKLFSKKTFEKKNKDELNHLFKATIYNFGNVKNFELDHWATSVTSGSDATGQYLMLYYVTRHYKHTFEKLAMVKENDSIKIIAYEIRRDAYY